MTNEQPFIPEGFYLVRVIVTHAEYEELRLAGSLLGEGTPGAALRHLAGLPSSPYGVQAARVRALMDEADL